MFCPPIFSLHVRIVSKLHPALLLVRPLVRIPVSRIHDLLSVPARIRNRIDDRRRVTQPAAHILPNLPQRGLHRHSHLEISLFLFGAVRHMEDVLVQSGRCLCGRGTGVADGFVGAQEGGDLRGRGEAGEEVTEDGCVFDLEHRRWGTIGDTPNEVHFRGDEGSEGLEWKWKRKAGTHGHGRPLCSVWLDTAMKKPSEKGLEEERIRACVRALDDKNHQARLACRHCEPRYSMGHGPLVSSRALRE